MIFNNYPTILKIKELINELLTPDIYPDPDRESSLFAFWIPVSTGMTS